MHLSFKSDFLFYPKFIDRICSVSVRTEITKTDGASYNQVFSRNFPVGNLTLSLSQVGDVF